MTREDCIARARWALVESGERGDQVATVVDALAVVEMAHALERWTLEYEGLPPAELAKRTDPATIERLRQSKAVLAKLHGDTDHA